MHKLRPADMIGFQDPFEALKHSFQLACRGCECCLNFTRPPGAAWTAAQDAPPLLMICVEEEASRAAPEGAVALNPEQVHTLKVPMGSASLPWAQAEAATVELKYRLVAALMYKPGHYATCTLDEETGQWLLFDGMLQGEGREGPNGRGRVISPPCHAQSLGGKYWSVVMYARV